MEEKKDPVRRFPLWMTRLFGVWVGAGGALLAGSDLAFCLQNGWNFPQFYAIVVGASLFLLGAGMACAQKGLPMGWKERARLSRQARETPEGLSEGLSREERLEHLKTMKEQGVLSEEEAAEWRRKIEEG